MRKISYLFMALLITFTTFAGLTANNEAHAYTNKSYENKINSLDQQKKQKLNDIQNQQAKINQNKADQAATQKQIVDLENKVAATNDKIDATEKSIKETNASIDDLKKSIEVVKGRISRRNQLIKERAKAIYKNGGPVNYMQVILGAQSFGDLLQRVVAVNTIAQSDNKILDAQKHDQADLEKKQQSLETKLADIKKQKADLVSLKGSLASTEKKKQSLLRSLKSDAESLGNKLLSMKETADLLAAQEKAIKSEYENWKKEQARLAAERKRRQQSSKAGSSTFIWPTHGVISSPFGWRSWDHEFHPGIDIANRNAGKENIKIVAAASGTVIRSYLSTSYGNVVFLTHYINGQIYTTVYAHMKKRLVSTGQHVSQGQTLGYMGSTGWSTGYHLHFELHKGQWNYAKSNAVNPLKYLPK